MINTTIRIEQQPNGMLKVDFDNDYTEPVTPHETNFRDLVRQIVLGVMQARAVDGFTWKKDQPQGHTKKKDGHGST